MNLRIHEFATTDQRRAKESYQLCFSINMELIRSHSTRPVQVPNKIFVAFDPQDDQNLPQSISFVIIQFRSCVPLLVFGKGKTCPESVQSID